VQTVVLLIAYILLLNQLTEEQLMADMIQIRRDTAANWTSANPILAQGELGAETNTSKIKIGNGSSAWNALSYLIDAGDYLTASSTNTLTNKTIAYANNTLTGVVGTAAAQTLTNKTIAFADNTLTGVQPALVSGTSIKTINSNTLLGSGDLAVGDVTLAGAQTFTGTKTFAGTSSAQAIILNDAAEVATVSATAATGTIAYDITTQSVLYYTSNASANWTVNFRGSSGTSLDTLMSTGQSMTVAFLVTQGSTAYYNSAVQIDGTTSGVTTVWLGGAPTAGNASGIDSYRYLIIKTGSATFTVLASNTQFKA
jgi:hypothetical protein